MLRMVGDFETTIDEKDVRVWGWGLVNIDTSDVVEIGTNIESFFNHIHNKHCEIYFHNLKFDGEFIIHYLLSNGWKHGDSKEPNTFETLITDDGAFYSITCYYKKLKKRYVKVTFYDSLKKLPFPVSVVAKAFNLPEAKGSIDYKAYRAPDHQLTEEEREYIIIDCMIVAKALKHQFDNGLDRMTIGSDALNGFKDVVTQKRFINWFPLLPLEDDEDIRRSYKGGFTYLNPKYKNERVSGVVFDVNSLYPSVMYDCPLPFGYPIFFDGEYESDDFYPLYIQRLRCEFKIKPNHIPTIQLKNNRSFVQTEYLSDSNGEIVEITLTSVDLELFFSHYEVYNLEYISGWMFKSCTGVFCDYIDHWSEIKENSTGGTRTLAKLMLNSLYGKFATNPLSIKKIPYLDDNNVVRYETEEPEFRKPVYTAVGSFITAWARYKTITSAQANYDRFIYADTDSLHLIGEDMPSDLDIHPTKLGKWKYEGYFSDGKYLRAKTYMHTHDGEITITCAGMPDTVKAKVTYDNFTVGSSFSGKLKPSRHAGGVVLQDTNFTILA